jgi:hypothetical protein
MHTRRILAGLAAVAALATSVSVAAQDASATASPAESVTANLFSGPFHVQIHARRAANAPSSSATGVFSAQFSLGGVQLFSVRGPVTCLDVRGTRMGLFYPITSSSPSVLAQFGSGVFFNLQVSSTGRPMLIGFAPSPSSHATSCPPGLALFPVTSGTATLTP